jgi:hypothetical protein
MATTPLEIRSDFVIIQSKDGTHYVQTDANLYSPLLDMDNKPVKTNLMINAWKNTDKAQADYWIRQFTNKDDYVAVVIKTIGMLPQQNAKITEQNEEVGISGIL